MTPACNLHAGSGGIEAGNEVEAHPSTPRRRSPGGRDVRGRAETQPNLRRQGMKREGDPEGEPERLGECEAERPEDADPDPDHSHPEPDGKRTDHPSPVDGHLVRPDGPIGENERQQEVGAEHPRCQPFYRTAEGDEDPEHKGEHPRH